eukprot:COSAG04_NODE_6475_length_1319_cov_1.336885_2_plen_65_part_00
MKQEEAGTKGRHGRRQEDLIVGITGAWWGECTSLPGPPREAGMVHGVGIHPDFGGRGLSKPVRC